MPFARGKIFFASVVFAAVLGGPAHSDVSAPPPDSSLHQAPYESVSLISLISNPERYDGKRVSVQGFLSIGFEDNGLYLDREAYQAFSTKDALWLDVGQDIIRNKDRLNHRYVVIVGSFSETNLGHGHLFSGTITRVTDARAANTRFEFAKYQIRGAFLAMWPRILLVVVAVGALALAIAWAFARRKRGTRSK
jgi:hypothetical protein